MLPSAVAQILPLKDDGLIGGQWISFWGRRN
jgi:hypothetical protein